MKTMIMNGERRLLMGLFGLGLMLTASNSMADHPTEGEMPQVKRLAHQLEIDSAQLHRVAEVRNHHRGYEAERALRAIHEFAEKAEHFHRQVEQYRRNPGHTESDYRELVYAYQNGERLYRYLHADSLVNRYASQVRQTMRELDYFYKAGRGESWNWRRAMVLAHEIENSASRAHRYAEADSRYRGPSENRFLLTLHELEESAGHFHDQIESRNSNPSHTVGDYLQVKRLYEQADRLLHIVHASRRVSDELYRMDQMMREMERIYSRRGGGHGGGHGR